MLTAVSPAGPPALDRQGDRCSHVLSLHFSLNEGGIFWPTWLDSTQSLTCTTVHGSAERDSEINSLRKTNKQTKSRLQILWLVSTPFPGLGAQWWGRVFPPNRSVLWKYRVWGMGAQIPGFSPVPLFPTGLGTDCAKVVP